MTNKNTEKQESKPVDPTQESANVAAKQIDSHKQAAAHHIAAAKHHLKAAEHFENGARGKSAKHAMLAYGHSTIAGEFHSDAAKHHAQTSKETKYR